VSRTEGEGVVDAVVEETVEAAEAAVKAVDDAVPNEDGTSGAELGEAGRRAARMGTLFALLAVAMVPWAIYLAVTLPTKETARHYDLAWVGFDAGLMAVLAWTAWCALRRSRNLTIAASMNATMLIIDAWFDVVTAPHSEFVAAVVMALLVELPLSFVCIWLARNGQEIVERKVQLRMRGVHRLRRRRAR